MTSALNPGHPGNDYGGSRDVVGACVIDPDRWSVAADETAKAICRTCARRWLCARDAVETPGAEGVWAGIEIPESGRGRTFALRQLRSLAERGGYPVRTSRRRRFTEPDDGDHTASVG